MKEMSVPNSCPHEADEPSLRIYRDRVVVSGPTTSIQGVRVTFPVWFINTPGT